MDFVPLYFPGNDGEKTEYVKLTRVAPDQQTGERPEIFQEEGKYLHIYLDFIRSTLEFLFTEAVICVCVCLYSYYPGLNGKVLLFSKI